MSDVAEAHGGEQPYGSGQDVGGLEIGGIDHSDVVRRRGSGSRPQLGPDGGLDGVGSALASIDRVESGAQGAADDRCLGSLLGRQMDVPTGSLE